MPSPYAAAAQGIESGFNLGLRADEAQQRKDQLAYDRNRQAASDARASEELGIKRTADARQERRLNDAEKRDISKNAMTALEGRRKELTDAATAAQVAGGTPPPGSAEEYASVSKQLDSLRQSALNDASRLSAGQTSLESMPPAQLYKAVTVGTGMSMKDLANMPQHAADLQAGMETGNNGLTLQAVNGLLGPRLRQGIGEEVPSGGKITRKEIINLVPARDANGNTDPDKVFPVVRVYVQRPGDTKERYYDAPMTKGASVQDEQVEPISVQKSLDWVGHLGVLTTALQRPDLKDKLAQGEKEAGPEVNKYFDQFYALTKPAKKQITRTNTDLGDRVRTDETDSTGRVVGTTYEKKGAAPRDRAGIAQATMDHRLDLLTDLFDSGGMGDPDSKEAQEEYKRRSGDIIQGITSRPKEGGANPTTGLSEKYNTDESYRGDVDYWAKMIAAGGELPPRFAQSGAGKAMFQDIIQRVPALGGNDPRAQLANRAEYGGAKAGARTVGQRSANFELAKSEAYAMADLVTEASANASRTEFMPINKALQAYEKNTGDPEIVKFGASLNSFVNAYARAVSPIGSPTVNDKEHAREMLQTAQSHGQVAAVIDQLKKEMEAAGRAPEVVRGKQREAVLKSAPEIDKPPTQRGIPTQQPRATLREGGVEPKVRTATNPQTGEKLMLQNGQWVPFK